MAYLAIPQTLSLKTQTCKIGKNKNVVMILNTRYHHAENCKPYSALHAFFTRWTCSNQYR